LNILIIDDHPLIREGLTNVLQELDPDGAVLEAVSVETTLQVLATQPTIALVLPGAVGMSLLERIREERPEVPVVVLSANDSRDNVIAALDCGAMGFISKRSPTVVLVSALRLVLVGGVYVPPQALGPEHPPAHPPAPSADVASPPNTQRTTLPAHPGRRAEELGLTTRQIDVLALLVQGRSNKAICNELGLADGTVKSHIAAIFRALNVTNRTEALFALNSLAVKIPELVRRLGTP
jgi:DNA-binding NarL/FixJ family response regulator